MNDEKKNNVIKLDFDGRRSESKYYNIEADKSEIYDPIIVSVHSEGIEVLQHDGDEMHEIFITDEQLASLLLILTIEGETKDGEQEPPIYDA